MNYSAVLHEHEACSYPAEVFQQAYVTCIVAAKLHAQTSRMGFNAQVDSYIIVTLI